MLSIKELTLTWVKVGNRYALFTPYSLCAIVCYESMCAMYQILYICSNVFYAPMRGMHNCMIRSNVCYVVGTNVCFVSMCAMHLFGYTRMCGMYNCTICSCV